MDLYFNGGNVGVVKLSSDVPLGLEAAVRDLSILCHERSEYKVDGKSLPDWIGGLHESLSSASLSNDVLQIVTVSSEDVPQFKEGRLNSRVGSVIMRDASLSKVYSDPDFKMPPLLNSQDREFAAHGRGVVFLGGHRRETENMLGLLAIQAILVSTQLRSLRDELKHLLEEVKEPPQVLENAEAQLRKMKVNSHRLRVLQAQLAIDVSPVITGLESPDLVADSFRNSFHDALGLKELYSDGQQLVSTFGSTMETTLREFELLSERRSQIRDSRWQFFVGAASGVVVPIALVLSYFGVGTTEVGPGRSMFDSSYRSIWIVTALAMVVIVFVSAVGFLNRKRGFDLNGND
ncbi:hypothetical protein G6010_12720 [Dietzia sp. SLG510A3-3B2-2]|nr:hypothetical protein [Dietzia sp. SLG510A3-40A3]MBB1010348.1 hypothetical protein [Dietzia sp. SLG510A3-3B2-2]